MTRCPGGNQIQKQSWMRRVRFRSEITRELNGNPAPTGNLLPSQVYTRSRGFDATNSLQSASLDGDPLNVIQADGIIGAVVELGRTRRFVGRKSAR